MKSILLVYKQMFKNFIKNLVHDQHRFFLPFLSQRKSFMNRVS